MNTRQIQYAVELSKTLNISQAAERLGISQPALSKQILHLEEDLGIKLFDRSTVPMTLTAAGKHFIREAQALLYREDQLMRSLEAYKSGESGQLVIGATPFRCQYLIPPVVQQVRERYPNVFIDLQEMGSEELRQGAAEGKFDFAVVNLPVDEALLDVTLLEQDTLVLAVPAAMASHLPESDSEHPVRIALSLCADLPFVTVGEHQEMRRLFEDACIAARFHPQIAAEAVGLSTAWALCCAGVGATLLPLQYVRQNGGDKRVRLYTLKQVIHSRQPAVVTCRGQYLSPYAAYAIGLLCGHGENRD